MAARRPGTAPQYAAARDGPVNFARDVVDAMPPERRAIVELARDGRRREWTFGEVSDRSARLAGTLARHGVGRGDVVMTLIGNRPEWVLTMVACFRLGAVVLACNEQLRAKDLRIRLDAARPALIVADERDVAELSAASPSCVVLTVPDDSLFAHEPAPAAELDPADACLITFTSGTTGEPKGVIHGQRYLPGQRLQAEHWLDARDGDLVWCTASTGWSKSARNSFIAPWLRGACALMHDARFDPAQRLALLADERVVNHLLHPARVGWRSVEDEENFYNLDLKLKSDARRFETGTLNIAGITALGASLDMLLEIGIDRIFERILSINDMISSELKKRDLKILSPSNRENRSGILSLLPKEAGGLFRYLLERQVLAAQRGSALRLSPHFYADERDVERFFEVLDAYRRLPL